MAMKYVAVRNTIREGIKKWHDRINTRAKLAVARAMEIIRGSVISPTWMPVRTGRLKMSVAGIPITADKGKTVLNEGIYELGQEKEKTWGRIGTSVPYARFIEYGTSRQKARRPFQQGISASLMNVNRVIANTLRGK